LGLLRSVEVDGIAGLVLFLSIPERNANGQDDGCTDEWIDWRLVRYEEEERGRGRYCKIDFLSLMRISES